MRSKKQTYKRKNKGSEKLFKSLCSKIPGLLKFVFFKTIGILWLIGIIMVVSVFLVPNHWSDYGNAIPGNNGFATLREVIISVIPMGQVSDKILRFLVFALLSFCPAACLGSMRRGLFIATGVAPFGFILEIIANKFVPSYGFSPKDVIIGNAGVIFGIVTGMMVRIISRKISRIYRKKALKYKTLPLESPVPLYEGEEPSSVPGTFHKKGEETPHS
ncbi:hypothetical protein QUF80_14260 [Desulfococcaceae bacterium HSG8]|nr:hypothetical protein [Desulfococcaceae bacterium HSG8]